jgi:hypothetical protein
MTPNVSSHSRLNTLSNSCSLYRHGADTTENTVFNRYSLVSCVSVAMKTCLSAATQQRPSLVAPLFRSLSYHVTVYFIKFWGKTAIIFLYSVNRLNFVMQMQYIICEVEINIFSSIWMNRRLQSVTYIFFLEILRRNVRTDVQVRLLHNEFTSALAQRKYRSFMHSRLYGIPVFS